MATKKMAVKKMMVKKPAAAMKKASPMKQGLPAGAEITGKYNERVKRGKGQLAKEGSKFGSESGVSIASNLQATAKPFNRRYATTPDNYTEVYGMGANGKEQRLFRGKVGMKATDDFVKESESKVKDVNFRRNKNANTYNAMQGPVSNLSNPKVLESAKRLGNVKVNPRTSQLPAKQMSPMDKKPMAKMKKC